MINKIGYLIFCLFVIFGVSGGFLFFLYIFALLLGLHNIVITSILLILSFFLGFASKELYDEREEEIQTKDDEDAETE